MKNRIACVCDIVADLVLGLWVGGSAMIVLSVINLFGYFGKDERGVAGAVAAPLFEKFFFVLLIGWVVLAVALIARRFLMPSVSGTRGAVIAFLMLLMFAATAAEHCYIIPTMATIRKEARISERQTLPEGTEGKERFDALHRASEGVMSLSLLFGVVVIALRASLRATPTATPNRAA